MIQTRTCPDVSRWQALLADSDASDSAELEAHLEGCSRCQHVLDDLAVGSSGWLRDANRLAAKPVDDAEMTRTLHRVREQLHDAQLDLPIALDFLSSSDQPGVIGTLGRYQVLEVLGRGAFGIVLKALDPDLLRPVAIKVLAPYLAPSGTARQRFLREARAAAAVSQDHIVTIHAVEAGEALPYIVMEYVTGISLQQRLDRDGPLAPAEIARIGHQAARGLAAAHAQGLVHRDIKPANILLENGVERVKITDFGLARAADDARLTQSGVAQGTPLYMSPEQARGETVDHRSDLFSLGSVLYTLATGFPPFRADSTMGVLNRITNHPPRPIRETIPDFPVALEKIIMQLLEKEPGKRFQLSADVSFKLAGFLSSPPRDSEPVPPDESETEPAEHEEPTKWWVTALCLLAAAAMVAIVLTFKTPKGTLIVEIDDPGIKVALDGEELKITGAGPQEVRLKPGDYHVTATKDGKPANVVPEIVTITKNGKQVVKVSIEPAPVMAGDTRIGQPAGKIVIDKSKEESVRKTRSEWWTKLNQVYHEYDGIWKALPRPPANQNQAFLDQLKKLRELDKQYKALSERAWKTTSQLEALDSKAPKAVREKLQSQFDSDYASLLDILKNFRELAVQLGARPALPPSPAKTISNFSNSEARQKKRNAEFRALMAEIEKTKIGSALLTAGPMADPDKVTSGMNKFDAARVKRLLVIRERFDLLVPGGQKALDRWEKAKLEFGIKEPNYKAGVLSASEWEQAKLELKQAERALQTTEDGMAALLADLDKCAKEMGVAAKTKADDPKAEFKKVMSEYDALVLRLAKTKVGRLLATIEPDQSWSTSKIESEVGTDSKMVAQGERLLRLRDRLRAQAFFAEKALSSRESALERKAIARNELKSGDDTAEMIQKSENELKFRTAALRGILNDLTKLADEIDPPDENSIRPRK